jgi:hypothetical protein
MHETFVHANVGRAGLGNMLFSWARADVFSHRFKVPMLAPQWTQPKIGPFLRGEKDLRYYTGLFDNLGYIRGARRVLTLLSRRRIDGTRIGINADPPEVPASYKGALVVFGGWQGWFREDLWRHRQYVRSRLESIVSDRVRREMQSFDMPLEIAVHVRRGDVRVEVIDEKEQYRDMRDESVADSEHYFLSVLRGIRRTAGRCVPATVFTDARQGDLKEIPREEGVHIAGGRSAIADMLLMSHAAVLIASSSSSFSAWASYLGAMPTVWHRGRVRAILPDRPELAIESDPHGRISDRAQGLIGERLDAGTTETRT